MSTELADTTMNTTVSSIDTSSIEIDKEKLREDEERSSYIGQNYVMVVLIALVQGTLDLCQLAYFYIYLYDNKASPAELAVLQGIGSLPWVFKPFFGFIADRFQFLGYHKKSYIFAFSLLEFLMHTTIFKFKFDTGFVLICNFLQVGCVVFRNVIGESLIVMLTKQVIIRDNTPEAERSSLAQKHVTLFFGAKAVGSIIGAWQSTVLMEFYGNRGIFLFSSVLPLVIMIYCSFFYDEYQEEGNDWFT